MAQKRMLDRKISVSEQVANLPIEAKLIFTWSIPHADDLGLLPSSTRSLKAMIVPMLEMSLEVFEKNVKAIVKEGLWEVFEYGNEKYYRLPAFFGTQTLKKDRNPNTILLSIKNWKQAEDIGFHLEDIGNLREGKLREVKGSEDKEEKGKASVSYLSNIPEEDIKEFTERFIGSPRDIRSKAEDLKNYCEMHSKRYRNYRAFLINALKKDFKERPKIRHDPPPTPEEVARIVELRKGAASLAKTMRVQTT